MKTSIIEQRKQIQAEILKWQGKLAESDGDESLMKEVKASLKEKLTDVLQTRDLLPEQHRQIVFMDTELREILTTLGFVVGKAGKGRRTRKPATGEVRPQINNDELNKEILAFFATEKSRKDVVAKFDWYDSDYIKHVKPLIDAGCITERTGKGTGKPKFLIATGKPAPVASPAPVGK